MKILLHAQSSTSSPQEAQRQLETMRRSLAAEDSVAGACSDLNPGGSAHRPGLVQVLTLLNAGEVGEIHALSLDRLARTPPELEALQEFLCRHGLALTLLEEDAEDHERGGR